MDLEINDTLKANEFSIKFVGIRTPTSLPRKFSEAGSLPNKLHFSFKFYKDHNYTQTSELTLNQSNEILDKISKKKMGDNNQIELGKQYYFIKPGCLEKLSDDSDIIPQILENSEVRNFRVDPTETRNKNEHIEFAHYLNESKLKIDVYYDQYKSFGRVIVPL